MTRPPNEGGASAKTRLPQMTISSSTLSGLSSEKTSQLHWARVALSRDELREWLSRTDAAKLFLEEVSENV